MRTKLRGKISLLFMMCAVLIAVPAVAALADDIRDGLDTSANLTQTITAGDSTSAGFTNQYWIVANGAATNDAGGPGCDVGTADDSITATFTVNTPSGVTASASSLTFDECRVSNKLNSQSVKFTSNTPGTYTIPALTKTGGTGVYTTDNTSFTLVVQDNCPNGDQSGNRTDGTCAAPVTNTKPALTLPANITEEATGASGAAVSYTATANDKEDGALTPDCSPKSGSTFPIGTTTVNCSATDSGNLSASGSFNVTVQDKTGPVLKLPADITEEATSANGAVVNFTATASDLVDGSVSVSCSPDSGTFALGTTTVNCSATDKAGNESTGSFSVKVEDTTAPTNIQFVGDFNDPFFFGDVPAAPTCTADDAVSGMKSCVVSGYSTAVGTHTLKATATDNAGNESTKEISYTVKPYTLNGFYQPIDMNNTVNTVKNGSTVPVKFELFKGTTELTNTSAVTSIKATPITCGSLSGSLEDAIETTATGGTSLRYDATAGQFIYNWTTPKGASQVGKCYSLTMTAADSSTMTAYFKLK